MRAVVITRPGGPEVLEIVERGVPETGAAQVLVRVRASALNRADLMQREGHYPAPPGAPIDVPGLEFAGEIAKLGAGVDSWAVGERVFGIVAGGGHADYVVTHASAVARVPDNLSWTDAAAIPEAFITAYDALVTQAALSAGEMVLVHAAGSGVGLAGIQLARAWKATPFGTARTADKIDRARDYGLVDGIVVGRAVDDVVPAVERWTSGHGADVVVDLLGGPYVDVSIRAAAQRGRIMLVGTIAGRTPGFPLGLVLAKRLTLRGTVLRGRSVAEKSVVTAAFSREVVPLLASGELRPVVDSVYDLENVRAAHERLAGNAAFGKIVLRM